MRRFAASAVKRLVKRTFRFERMIIVETDLTQPFPTIAPKDPYEIGFANEGDLDELSRFLRLSRDALSTRLANGEWCLLALAAGRIIHACWAAAGPVYSWELEKVLPPEEGIAHLYNAQTDRDHQGQGLFQMSIGHLNAFLKARGYRRSRGAIRHGNARSLRAATKAKLLPVGEETNLRVLGLRFRWSRPWNGGGRGEQV